MPLRGLRQALIESDQWALQRLGQPQIAGVVGAELVALGQGKTGCHLDFVQLDVQHQRIGQARQGVRFATPMLLERDVGDFVLLRADGQYAYQLAVVVDDAAQGVNAVVRGADLLDSTARQLWLMECLGLSVPSYAHLPVAVNPAGEKLSKQTRASAIDPSQAVPLLTKVMRFLGQPVLEEIEHSSLNVFWSWAIAHWDLSQVPRVRAIYPGSD